MNAGGILGLMAGLGALSAMNKGGQGGTGKRFTGLMDMLDGGGAGQSGDRFEGGGLLSALGNLFMKPIAAQDNVERIARETNAAKSAAKDGFTPPVSHQDPYIEEQKARLSPEDILMGMPTKADKFGAQAAAEAGMGLSPFEAGPVDPSELARMRASKNPREELDFLSRPNSSSMSDPEIGWTSQQDAMDALDRRFAALGRTQDAFRSLRPESHMSQSEYGKYTDPEDSLQYLLPPRNSNYEVAVAKAVEDIKKIVPNFDSLESFEKEQLIRGALNNMNMMSGPRS